MKTIIIDDEKNIREGLCILLKAHPEINIVAQANDIKEAKTQIENLKPELVFLDIKLKNSTGFNLLDNLDYKEFKLIFITAYNEYAVKAFKYNAFDYLLKPIDPSELYETLQRLKHQEITYKEQANLSKDNKALNRIVIKTAKQIFLIDLNDIVRCESDEGYTKIYLNTGKNIISAKTLKEYNKLLPESTFIRVHQSHLVNVTYIKEYLREGKLKLENDILIPVSTRKRNEINKRLNS